MEPVLSLRSITLTYHSPDAETLAIKDLNLDVERGEFVAIVGRPDAGSPLSSPSPRVCSSPPPQRDAAGPTNRRAPIAPG